MATTIERSRYFGHHFPDIDKEWRDTLSIFLTGDVDAREGLGSNGVVVGEFTLQDVDGVLLFDTDAAAGVQYLNRTTELNAGTFTFVVTAANDALYLGMQNLFSGLFIDMGTAGTATTVLWEYWNGSAWVSLATAHNLIDDSNSLTAGTSDYNVTWKVPSNWVKRDVGDAQASIANLYWIRLRAAGNYAVDPVITALDVYEVVSGVGLRVPYNGYLERVNWHLDFEGDSAALVINVINRSTGEVTAFSIPATERTGTSVVDAVKGLYFKKGDELLLQAVSTATNEHANIQAILEFRV
jgi:hypothetical protein